VSRLLRQQAPATVHRKPTARLSSRKHSDAYGVDGALTYSTGALPMNRSRPPFAVACVAAVLTSPATKGRESIARLRPDHAKPRCRRSFPDPCAARSSWRARYEASPAAGSRNPSCARSVTSTTRRLGPGAAVARYWAQAEADRNKSHHCASIVNNPIHSIEPSRIVAPSAPVRIHPHLWIDLLRVTSAIADQSAS